MERHVGVTFRIYPLSYEIRLSPVIYDYSHKLVHGDYIINLHQLID